MIRNRRRNAVIGMLVSLALLASASCTGRSPRSEEPAPKATASTSQVDPTVPLCGYPDPGTVTAQAHSAPSHPIRTLIKELRTDQGLTVSTFAVSPTTIIVLGFEPDRGNIVTVYSAAGERQRSFVIAEPKDSGTAAMTQLALGPDGSIYTVGTGNHRTLLIKTSSTGQHVWSQDLQSELPDGASLSGPFAWHDRDGKFAVAVGVNGTSVRLVDGNGRVTGDPLDFTGYLFSPQSDGSLLTLQDIYDDQNQGKYVRSYDRTGRLVVKFGGLQPRDQPNGEYQMADPRGLSMLRDGRLLILDAQRGIEVADSDGIRQGIWASQAGDQDQSFTLVAGSPLIAHDDSYYFLATNDSGGVRLVSVTSRNMVAGLKTPVEHNAANEATTAVLGYGAGLQSTAELGYFPAGRTPSVHAVFDPWWSKLSARYHLRYTVTTDPRLPQPATARPNWAELPQRGGRVDLKLPAAQPGIYEVSADLIDRSTGAAVSGACLRYTVGSAGQSLDPAGLAAGADWGGPHPLRGVQLADQLRIGSYRFQLDFGSLVPDPKAKPTATGLSWDSLPRQADGDPAWAELSQAVQLARQKHVIFMIQLGQGGSAEQEAVKRRTWQDWVRLIVEEVDRHTGGVDYWLPWNEPNNSGFDGTSYVHQVLRPFAAGLHASGSEAKIVDANTLNVPIDWWQQYIAAGGTRITDVIAVHPYTGYNDSWEEWRMNQPDGDLNKLKKMLARAGAGDLPLWDTESGWWGDGPANFWAQGDDIARKLMWYRYQRVAQWTYFFSEGGFDNQGKSWSLIQYGSYLKTGAVAYMTTTALLADRGKPRLLDTGIPFSYAMRFPSSIGGADLVAAWTADFPVAAELSTGSIDPAIVTETNIYGATRKLTLQPGKSIKVKLGGSPLFYTVPKGTQLKLAPTQKFGPDVLKGRPVTASSTAQGYSTDAITAGSVNNPQPWMSGPKRADGRPDLAPRLSITTPTPTKINRVAVATPGIRCCTSGLRNYKVEARLTDGSWKTVASVTDQFYNRVVLVSFDPVTVTAVRIEVPSSTEKGVEVVSANYSGASGGLHPAWWKLESPGNQAVGVSAVSAWAPR